jgi:signal peptidase I
MEPGLKAGQTCLVCGWNRRLARGEIVVLDDGMKGGAVKRVVALPGETIRIDGAVWINNRRLNEPYLQPWMRTYCAHRKASEEYHLSQDQFFVMGDNRVVSEDSRDYGPINQGQVRGKLHTGAERTGFELARLGRSEGR